MDQILSDLALPRQDVSPAEHLARLVAAIRPMAAEDVIQATSNIRALTYLLGRHAEYRAGLRSVLIALFGATRQVQLYTDTGTLSNETFGQALRRRMGERLLPPARSEGHLADQFGVVFGDGTDYLWVAAVPQDVWQELWQAMAWNEVALSEANPTRLQLLEAAQVLTARITAIGLEPELVRIYPQIERFESPFLHLSAEAQRFVESARIAMTDPECVAEDDRHILVLLEQCEDVIVRLRKASASRGVSVSLTYHVTRLNQHIARLRMILTLLEPGRSPAHDPTMFLLLTELVKAENRKYSLLDVFSSNTELLARQVTEHAGRHGEHYIAENRSQWVTMGKAAMGAGLVVGFMALFKLLIATTHLPLIWEAIGFGLNYALGFMLIHLLHFTVATKQPAMTAAHIAAAIHDAGGRANMPDLVELVVKVMRTQFIAILGNVALAVPVAWAIAEGWRLLAGEPVIDAAKAHQLLTDLDPLKSLAIFHAAIAGVYLFLSGMIAGYYDNKAIYRQIPQRLIALPWLNRLLGVENTRQFAHYVETNLGGLAGNFYFGMFLGVTGTIGFLIGLPLDIRHITFAAANLSYAAVALDYALPVTLMIWSVVGVVLIGMTNLMVSFSLALWVALRSRKMQGSDVLPLLPAVLRRFVRHPQDFIYPPKEKLLPIIEVAAQKEDVAK